MSVEVGVVQILFQKQLGLQSSELVQLSNTHWACQLHSVSAVLENYPDIIECLSTINTAMAMGLKAMLSQFSSVYLLIVFQDLLSVTARLHRFQQKESIDLTQAMTYKEAVVDSLKEKRSEATAADLHAKTKALCEANQIAVPEPSSRPGVSNSIYLGAAEGRVWVRLGRIWFSTRKALIKNFPMFSNIFIFIFQHKIR